MLEPNLIVCSSVSEYGRIQFLEGISISLTHSTSVKKALCGLDTEGVMAAECPNAASYLIRVFPSYMIACQCYVSRSP